MIFLIKNSMDSKNFAYIDESGNSDLDAMKEGASNYFIVSAVIVSVTKERKLAQDAGAIRKKYFQSGEIKSSSVGNNKSRRAKILNAINKLDFKFYALCVNKGRIKKTAGYSSKNLF